MSHTSIIPRADLPALVDSLKTEGKCIVTTCGAFDLLHTGHLQSFLQAREHGDIFIVCLNSDSSIKAYKSPDRPIHNQEDRAEMLAALSCVDYVTIFDEVDPRAILKIIKPDTHVKSKTGFTGIEREVVEAHGGTIVLLDDVEGKSSTQIIEKIQSLK